MDFFQYQDDARRKTGLLFFYFILATCLIILFVYLSVQGANLCFIQKTKRQFTFMSLWNPELFLMVSLGTVFIIISGSLFKTGQLSKGGETIARLMNGRKVSPNTKDLLERKLMNVVEEMALASGTSVPSVFVLEP